MRQGTWDWFESNGRIKNEQAKSVLGDKFIEFDQVTEDAYKPVSHKIALKAHVVWKNSLLTEEQLAELLDLDRITLRAMLYEIENDESETNDFLKFTNV